MTPQRAYQLRMKAEGRCWTCGTPSTTGYCQTHRGLATARQRALRARKRLVFRAVEGAGL